MNVENEEVYPEVKLKFLLMLQQSQKSQELGTFALVKQ